MLLRTSVAFAVFVLVLRPGTVSECAQEPCTHIPHGSGESLEGFLHGGACQASNQGYIMRWSQYTFHTHAIAQGWCEHRSFPCPTCPCSPLQPPHDRNERDVISVGLGYYDPMWPTWLNPISPIYSSTPENHDLDSRIPGTSSPPPDGRGFTPYYVGRYALVQQSNLDPTACNMTPTTVQWSMALKSVDCLPTFRTQPNGTIIRVPNDATRVSIVAPFGPTHPITIAIEAAAKAWNAALVSWGESPIFDETAQTTLCTGSQGGHCVNVVIQHYPDAPLVCAAAERDPGGEDGIVDNNARIYIRPDYSTDPTYLRHLLSQELGHLLGLDDAVCGINSVMSGIAACNSLGTPPTVPSSPTPSDALPVADTSYGPGSRATCAGWAQ
jgi:hypothetical protein